MWAENLDAFWKIYFFFCTAEEMNLFICSFVNYFKMKSNSGNSPVSLGNPDLAKVAALVRQAPPASSHSRGNHADN